MRRRVRRAGRSAARLPVAFGLAVLLTTTMLLPHRTPVALATTLGYAGAFVGSTASELAIGNGIAVNQTGRAYLTGNFRGTVDFNPGPGSTTLTSELGQQDAYATSLDASGAVTGVPFRISRDGLDYGAGVATDGSNSYLTGYVNDPGTGGRNQAYVIKRDASDTDVWSVLFEGSGVSLGTGIAVDAGGNVYASGTFSGTVDFDPSPGSSPLTSGPSNAFVVKLNSSGGLVWAKQFGSTDSAGLGIGVDGAGNVYVLGGSDIVSGPPKMFVLKLDGGGGLTWQKTFGGTSSIFGNAIAVDTAGNVYLTGTFAGTVDFDPGPGTANLTSNGGAPGNPGAFVVKLIQAAPPVNGLPAAQPVTADDAPLVFSTARGNRISVTDPDNGSSPLRVTLSISSGTLSLAGVGGLVFSQGDGTADATMTFSGTPAAINAALDGLTFTPVLAGPATASLQIISLDQSPSGGQTDTDTLTIVVGRRPVAVNDGVYVTNTRATLSVPIGTGLLVNDTDADTPTPSLQATVVTGPTRGTLDLQPNGSFTYAPTGSTGGTDTFSYRVTDSTGLVSNTATATITITAVACGPRPTVTVSSQVVNGALQATVAVTETGAPTNNLLQSIAFGTLDGAANAQVTLNGETVASGQTVTLPANTTTQAFTVRRATAGQPTTVQFTVADACGSWPSFVRGGPSAGF